jgi:hypothetical protein
MITGKPDQRVLRGFYDVRIYKEDQTGENTMSGRSDSIFSDQSTSLTKLINISGRGNGDPVLWSGENQMTGDSIHLQSNPKTEQLDSLLVFDNAFLIQKDTIEGYNQLKGKILTGYFRQNELYEVIIDKNTETLNYMRNSENQLIGINKTLASSIIIYFENQQIEYIDYLNQVDGALTPEADFPPNARMLQGFNWRGEERILSKEGLFEGKPEPELTKIKGIPLPEEPEEFFDERDEDDLLLDRNSRLSPDVLKNIKVDSIKSEYKEKSDSLKVKSIIENDTLKTLEKEKDN